MEDEDEDAKRSSEPSVSPVRAHQERINDTNAISAAEHRTISPAMMDLQAIKSIKSSRKERHDTSWEDVSSSGEDEGMTETITNGQEVHAVDGWEDQSSSEDEAEEVTESDGRRSSSSKKALSDYQQSKQALLNSEANNVERFNLLMRGNQQGNGHAGVALGRADTADRLEKVEPFSAARGTDAYEEADGVGRAHEVQLTSEEDEGDAKTPTKKSSQQSLHRPNHSRRSSNASRSPFLSARDDSASQAAFTLLPQAAKNLNEDQDIRSKDIYASEPVSPVIEEDENPGWKDAQKKSASINQSEGPFNVEVAAIMRSPGKKFVNIPKSTPLKHKTSTIRAEKLSTQLDQLADAAPPFSLWDYLKEEVMATNFDSTQELKWERVTNFIAIPFWMEKIMIFGFAVCLDSFLYTFTILPLRSLVAFVMWIRNTVVWLAGGQRRYLHSSHKCDILKALLIIMSCYILSRISDASKMYHSVRGQDVVKLYVIFNVLEIADRLCCSFGQDLLDSLFSRLTLARRKDGGQPYLRPAGFFLLSLGYVLAHTLVLFYQLVTLNVAINSYDNALLTLLLSNQFVEIKGSVFKKFEKENLFQLTCADIVERFQLTLMLSAIGLRNLIEVAGASSGPSSSTSSVAQASRNASTGAIKAGISSLSASALLGPLPTSFTVFPSLSLLETTFTPVCIVLASECLVDWLKHAFITKFNHIRPSVYGRFMDVLCRDLTIAGKSSNQRRRHTFVDQSPIVSRRLGFAAIPLACLLVRMTSQIMGMLHDDSHFDECAMPNYQQDGLNAPPRTAVSLAWSALSSTLVFILQAFTEKAEAKVETALNYIVSASAWILTIFIAWIL